MGEKLYKHVSFAGTAGMIVGILVIINGVVSVTAGIMTLVEAVKLRAAKKLITF